MQRKTTKKAVKKTVEKKELKLTPELAEALGAKLKGSYLSCDWIEVRDGKKLEHQIEEYINDREGAILSIVKEAYAKGRREGREEYIHKIDDACKTLGDTFLTPLLAGVMKTIPPMRRMRPPFFL